MIVSDFIDIIYDAVGTPSDYLNKSVSPMFTNTKICRQLMLALHKYANYTKALEEYHSLPVASQSANIELPSDIIRSEGIRFVIWLINGMAYPLMNKNLNNTWGNFPTPIQGLPRWFNVWKDRINFYPQNSSGYNTAVLTSNITASATTIAVNDKSMGVYGTSGFPAKNGRFTIGDEIIEYDYTSAGSFYGCRRGQEDTTAATHASGAAVNENNVWIYYYRLHFDITPVDDVIPGDILSKEMLIPEDHLEIIADYTAYKLLKIVDVDRAAQYKINFDEWLKEAKYQINKGRSRINKAGNIRGSFPFEQPTPYYNL